MKKGNITILASIFIMTIVAAGVSVGTQAWFSTAVVPVGATTFQAGIMAMSDPVGGSFSTPNNWAPCDTFTVTFELDNTGNIDILFLATSFTISPSGSMGQNFASNIEVTAWDEYIPGVGWQDNFGAAQVIETLVGDGAAPLTLLEMVQSYTPDEIAHHAGTNTQTATFSVLDQFGNYVKSDSDYVTGGGYDQAPGPAIIAGGANYKMKLTFHFMATAGNNLQGKTLTLDTSFFGMQDLSQRP